MEFSDHTSSSRMDSKAMARMQREKYLQRMNKSTSSAANPPMFSPTAALNKPRRHKSHDPKTILAVDDLDSSMGSHDSAGSHGRKLASRSSRKPKSSNHHKLSMSMQNFDTGSSNHSAMRRRRTPTKKGNDINISNHLGINISNHHTNQAANRLSPNKGNNKSRRRANNLSASIISLDIDEDDDTEDEDGFALDDSLDGNDLQASRHTPNERERASKFSHSLSAMLQHNVKAGGSQRSLLPKGDDNDDNASLLTTEAVKSPGRKSRRSVGLPKEDDTKAKDHSRRISFEDIDEDDQDDSKTVKTTDAVMSPSRRGRGSLPSLEEEKPDKEHSRRDRRSLSRLEEMKPDKEPSRRLEEMKLDKEPSRRDCRSACSLEKAAANLSETIESLEDEQAKLKHRRKCDATSTSSGSNKSDSTATTVSSSESNAATPKTPKTPKKSFPQNASRGSVAKQFPQNCARGGRAGSTTPRKTKSSESMIKSDHVRSGRKKDSSNKGPIRRVKSAVDGPKPKSVTAKRDEEAAAAAAIFASPAVKEKEKVKRRSHSKNKGPASAADTLDVSISESESDNDASPRRSRSFASPAVKEKEKVKHRSHNKNKGHDPAADTLDLSISESESDNDTSPRRSRNSHLRTTIATKRGSGGPSKPDTPRSSGGAKPSRHHDEEMDGSRSKSTRRRRGDDDMDHSRSASVRRSSADEDDKHHSRRSRSTRRSGDDDDMDGSRSRERSSSRRGDRSNHARLADMKLGPQLSVRKIDVNNMSGIALLYRGAAPADNDEEEEDDNKHENEDESENEGGDMDSSMNLEEIAMSEEEAAAAKAAKAKQDRKDYYKAKLGGSKRDLKNDTGSTVDTTVSNMDLDDLRQRRRAQMNLAY